MNLLNCAYIKIVFLSGLFAQLIATDLQVPDQLDENWTLQKPVRKFVAEQLFSHINGGAELFLEYGFTKLIVYRYMYENISLELEIYEMENANAALGIYLSKTGRETPQEELSVRNTVNQYQLVFTCGRYFIMVNNFSGNRQLAPLMTQLSKIIIDQIKILKNENLLSFLPEKNIIEDSQTIFRGPYGLQSVYTFGKGDVLCLKGKIFGVAANYSADSTDYITKLVIPYPSLVLAEEAYNHLIMNLDPYHEIIEKNKDSFIFKDYNQKYGKVIIDDSLIRITVHLSSNPK
jgi:hypothetical protein